MTLVAGIDSSTQACKVVVCAADTGEVRRRGRASHPEGTEVHPAAWLTALHRAVDDAGGLAGVAAVAVAGQQHGMVALNAAGEVLRPALLWNDTRSAAAAEDLVAELGADVWASATGSVPVASFTVTKLRWLAAHEPHLADRLATVVLPHDWLTAQLTGEVPVTDRGDASGTGYWGHERWRADLISHALHGRSPEPSVVLGPAEIAGEHDGALVGPGTGDNMAAALGLDTGPGDVVVSLGTSGTTFSVTDAPTDDPTGTVAGFADATGRWLPLVCTLNGARVLAAGAELAGVDTATFDRLALAAPPGADGLAMVPYLEGERTPNLPDATGSLVGLTAATMTPAHLARATVEGVLAGLAVGVDALRAAGVSVRRAVLVGGAARSVAVRALAPSVLGLVTRLPEPDEYVAIGAARQAAWTLAGGDHPPAWPARPARDLDSPEDWGAAVRSAHAGAKARLHPDA